MDEIIDDENDEPLQPKKKGRADVLKYTVSLTSLSPMTSFRSSSRSAAVTKKAPAKGGGQSTLSFGSKATASTRTSNRTAATKAKTRMVRRAPLGRGFY